MDRKIRRVAIASAFIVAVLATISPAAHAQFNMYAKPDRTSYVPGDSGTLTVTVVNTGSGPLQLNNITIYFPWAQFDSNGNWQGNVSSSSTQLLAAPSSSNPQPKYTFPVFQFTIPSWWGYGSQSFGGCPGSTNTRYGEYSSCIMVGTAGNPYEGVRFSAAGAAISMAVPTYTPLSIVSEAIPIATLVVLAVATVFLALIWTSSRRKAKA